MTTPAPAVASYVPTYASRSPYITRADFMAYPTGADVSQLLPDEPLSANLAALDRVIARASSDADIFCMQVLAATSDVQSGEYRIRREGVIKVPCDYTPIIMVTNVAMGTVAGQLGALSDLSGLRIKRKVVTIPVSTLSPFSLLNQSGAARAMSGYVFADVMYVNGYGNTTLSAACTSAAASVQVANPLGIFAGLPMTIHDGASTEPVSVASSYTIGSSTVPLASATTYAHTAGVTITAFPEFIRDAVTLFTAGRIKMRGAEGLVMGAIMEQAERTVQLLPGGPEEFEQAADLLIPLRRTW